MKSADARLNIIILDACRDNPFKRSFRSSAKGLARMKAPMGSIIAYSTAPGSVSSDGTGRNGLYTSRLMAHIRKPGMKIEEVFKQTRIDVVKASENQGSPQVPWESSSLMGDFYFASGTTIVDTPAESSSNFGSKPGRGSEWTDPVTGMKFVWVPGGCFKMGQTDAEKIHLIKAEGEDKYNKYFKNELPRHEVCLDGFWMGKFEVTNGQYRQYKSHHDSKDYEGESLNSDNQPVVNVSWEDAKGFITWLNKKSEQNFALLTEAQWEYACRGETQTQRFWGDDPDQACRYTNVHDVTSKRVNKFSWSHHDCDDGFSATSPVGSFQPNPFGLYDMLGNVWEWCEDIYAKDAYKNHARNNPIYASGGSYRVNRGGSWFYKPAYVRCASRYGSTPDDRSDYLGFRLVRKF